MDPELARGVQARLLRLAREEEVVALVRRADQLAAGAARADRDAPDSLRACGKTSGSRPIVSRTRPAKLVDADRLGQPAAVPDLAERPLDGDRRARRRAARCCRSRGARRARGGTRPGSGRRRRAPRGGRAGAGRSRRGSFRQNMPWWTITSCAPAAAARSKSSREDETPQAIFVTSSAPSTCRPGVPYSGKRSISSSSFAYPMISSRWATGPIIATLCALGVWRSLVARSVRVGEVRSSNLRTPIDVGEPSWFPHALSGVRMPQRSGSGPTNSTPYSWLACLICAPSIDSSGGKPPAREGRVIAR